MYIITSLYFILDNVLSMAVSSYFSDQYAHVGDSSPHVVNTQPNLNISLSTNDPSGSTGGSPMDTGNSMDIGSSDQDSGMGSSIFSFDETSSDVDRGIAKHVERDVLERIKLLNAMDARDCGDTLTEEQITLLNANPNSVPDQIMKEIVVREDAIHQIRVDTAENPKSVSSGDLSSEGESSDGEMRKAMDESRREYRDHFSNNTGESSKKGGSK